MSQLLTSTHGQPVASVSNCTTVMQSNAETFPSKVTVLGDTPAVTSVTPPGRWRGTSTSHLCSMCTHPGRAACPRCATADSPPVPRVAGSLSWPGVSPRLPPAPTLPRVPAPCSPAWHRGLNVERGGGHSQGMLMGARSLTGACALLSQTRCHKPAVTNLRSAMTND